MDIKKWAPRLFALLLPLALLAGCAEDGGGLSSFTAQTLEGEAFTQEDIQGKDLTILNFWATYCGPCLSEMPDLAAYEASLPENVQLITMCADGAGDPEGVKALLESVGFQGATLIAGDESFMALCQSVQSIPTTLFIDSRGAVRGKPIVGTQKDLAASFTQAANAILREDGKPEIPHEGA